MISFPITNKRVWSCFGGKRPSAGLLQFHAAAAWQGFVSTCPTIESCCVLAPSFGHFNPVWFWKKFVIDTTATRPRKPTPLAAFPSPSFSSLYTHCSSNSHLDWHPIEPSSEKLCLSLLIATGASSASRITYSYRHEWKMRNHAMKNSFSICNITQRATSFAPCLSSWESPLSRRLLILRKFLFSYAWILSFGLMCSFTPHSHFSLLYHLA